MIFQNIRIALRALSANKLRSILTMLGIIIGVGAVVALLSIGQGATASITNQVEGLGSNMVSVLPGRVFENRNGGGMETATLYYDDYEAIQNNPANMSEIAPLFQSRHRVRVGEKNNSFSVMGVTPEYASVRAFELANGRLIDERDQKVNAQVAVLGSQTATDLFGSQEAVGQRIKIDNLSFEVVGVLESKGSSGFGSEDDIVLIPLQTGYTKLFGSSARQDGRPLLSTINISAVDPDAVDDVMAQVSFLLRKQRGLEPGAEEDFTVVSQNQFLDTLQTITTTLTAFLGAIAAISLLVGGIGIMNIMLVSVTERTREIGLRKAVGAKRSAILMQFLIETVTLSVLGGLIGVLLGAGIAYAFTSLGVIEAPISPGTVALAFFFAVAVGVFFGIYPAFRASRLRPIEALRYE